jgi:hypothetical protein
MKSLLVAVIDRSHGHSLPGAGRVAHAGLQCHTGKSLHRAYRPLPAGAAGGGAVVNSVA